MTKREELQKQLKDAEDTIAKVRVELENEEKKAWKPALNQQYFYINCQGKAVADKWDGLDFEGDRLAIGNVFQTKELAEQEWAVQLAERRVRAAAKKHNVLKFTHEVRKLVWVPTVNAHGSFYTGFADAWSERIVFGTAEDCRNFIDEVGQEALKLYSELS